MGADMLGYQTMYPQEFTTDEKKKLNKHLDDVKALLQTANLAELVSKEEDAHGTYISKLNNLIPNFCNDLDNEGLAEEADEIQGFIETYLELIDDGREFIKKQYVDGRDVSDRYYTILGRTFVNVFAGEMSWGDEPQGGGYQTLKGLDRINLLGRIESLCIPQSQSLHFIKETEDEDIN